MKKNAPIAVFMLLAVVMLMSCKKDDEQPVVKPLDDNSLPSAAVSSITVAAKTSTTLDFSVNIAVFRDSKNIESQLKAEAFTIDTLVSSSLKYYFARQGVMSNNGSSASPYSALMLMDQSGSISSTDPLNYRLDAAKAFCNNLGSGDNVMLWSFTSGNLKQYGTGFTTNGSSVLPDIESLRGREGGGTPLYSSQYTVTNYVSTNAPAVNKAVMTFTDGQDTDGGRTVDDVINNAVAKNIKLFNVGLGSAEVPLLSRQAVKTGGAFMFAKDARQLISMFGNLGKLLDKSSQFYQTTWRITRSTGNFSTTGSITGQIRIKLPYGGSDLLIPFNLEY